jgi:3-hydroxyisobutyrate dehydrogenase-like beta-hydroxyacid dehydrogenase
MSELRIGFLHPGAMGVSLAATAKNSGHKSFWASSQRSPATRQRAETHGLFELSTVEELCEQCSVIVSVCPPHAATDVAKAVCSSSFSGIFVDVNAISPQRAQQIDQLLSAAQIDFVDGGIIGPPAWTADKTWLYLSGPSAGRIAKCFSRGPLEVEVIGHEAGKASALKMCFAANSKGTTALLSAIMAAADRLGIRQELENQWSRHGSDFAQSATHRIRKASAKGWRFAGEMDEIASTFTAVGLPEGFHFAAADIYRRMACFKDAGQEPSLEDIIDTLFTDAPQKAQS